MSMFWNMFTRYLVQTDLGLPADRTDWSNHDVCTYGVSAFATCTRKRDNTTDNVYPILNTANEIHQNNNEISLYYDASDPRSIIVCFLYVNGPGYSGIAVPADFDRKVEYLLLYNSSKNVCPLQRERRIMKPFLDAYGAAPCQNHHF